MPSNTSIEIEIARRNVLRSEAGLRLLNDRERERLQQARAQRIFDAVFASQQARFSHAWRSKTSWFAGLAEWSKARRQVREELQMGQHIEHALHELGYRLVDDAWAEYGRKTYCHDEDVDRAFLADLKRTLAQYSWKKHKTKLRCFSNDHTGELIEVEPGGADTSGHFLHHLKSE